MASGNFTWECWVRPTKSTGYQAFIDTRTNPATGDTTGFYFGTNTGTLTPVIRTTSTLLTSSINITLNAWNHVAVTRSSGIISIWVNGQNGGDAENTTTLSEQRIYIGSGGTNYYFQGYISNLRIVKGSAHYTVPFIPETSSLFQIRNTSLLLKTTFNAGFLQDSSINDFTITNNGAVTSSALNPF
jgi:hypothetical protein